MSTGIDERDRIHYEFPAIGTAIFIPVCEHCGRFVKADEKVSLCGADDGSWCGEHYEPATPNATCQRCGRVAMLWEGFL